MSEVYAQLPMPLLIGLMLFGTAVVLIACMPTAWVGRVVDALKRRFGGG
ncbi:MAG: hypothetical protein HY821_07815 [Acidobacteria bacterium]|nr:hypothetical protein [Acidobacteriota bacterium]